MRKARGKARGFTLIELVIALALLAIAVGLVYPGARAASDAWAVRAARDATASVLAWTRAAAIAQRGAELLLVQPEGSVLTRTRASAEADTVFDLERDWGVHVVSPGNSGDTITIRYDALGLGRIANRTLRFERGRAVAGLTISAYGRVRRW